MVQPIPEACPGHVIKIEMSWNLSASVKLPGSPTFNNPTPKKSTVTCTKLVEKFNIQFDLSIIGLIKVSSILTFERHPVDRIQFSFYYVQLVLSQFGQPRGEYS
jgi:hypothetical protein